MKGVSFTNKPYNISKSSIAGIGVIADKDFNKGVTLNNYVYFFLWNCCII